MAVSTMRDAAALASQGCAHGTAVVAEEQTSGIGRHGHSWHSEPAAGLYVSVVLRLPETTPILTLALGLAAVDAIRDTAGVVCDLRWPNDDTWSLKERWQELLCRWRIRQQSPGSASM